ncbi:MULTISPECIES: 5-(carboxyamino)imidazole ribonucleotide synthase [unclassified Gemella]|uniref:5-(carboxyamino)imidazole ribonucleotide synthase n=1 Tax=unclassified Gemella TaxID=2624949 RepID=UPI001C05E0B3|nr:MULTISPECIES: 5-(carboxyamino)imidazole ribonucleotide synthase [unclassified Gemella]MBU0278982.1 5-(carboxyamino)imidazole ribonucleotide synthase [Gemella sp. zg-1178]QWQ38754.1 5-(carboxyamino)imidazole ribonucleotide synthase [Gemella sp. zg-570]
MTLFKTINPPACIGIIGGGQLGKMLSVAAKTLGYKTIVLDPSENACAKGVADEFILADYNDKHALKLLAEKTDLITYEFENIPATSVKWLEECGGYVPQGYNALAISQDRLLEKNKLVEAGFEVAPYKKVDTKEELIVSCRSLGFPCILKTRFGGYDGKGQVNIFKEEDIEEASKLLSLPCILEKRLDFEKEVSAVCVKSVAGDFDIFPIGENSHKNSILHISLVPCQIEKSLVDKIQVSAKKFFENFNIVGILTIELFLVDGKLLANEIAPRPHNSGHWTIDAANISQFEQHIRAICNLPLLKSEYLQANAMINLLGQDYEILIKNISEIGSISKIHLYEKKGNAHNRKIGHLTVLDKDIENLKKKVRTIEKILDK